MAHYIAILTIGEGHDTIVHLGGLCGFFNLLWCSANLAVPNHRWKNYQQHNSMTHPMLYPIVELNKIGSCGTTPIACRRLLCVTSLFIGEIRYRAFSEFFLTWYPDRQLKYALLLLADHKIDTTIAILSISQSQTLLPKQLMNLWALWRTRHWGPLYDNHRKSWHYLVTR